MFNIYDYEDTLGPFMSQHTHCWSHDVTAQWTSTMTLLIMQITANANLLEEKEISPDSPE